MSAPPELDVSAELDRLAALANEGYDVWGDAWMLCALDGPETFTLAWDDFRDAVRDRDDVAPPAIKDWREVLSEDAAGSQDEAYQVLCGRADEALAVLQYGRPERAERSEAA